MLVQELLDRGAEILAPGPQYHNALIAASTNEKQDVVQLLLENGADPKQDYNIASKVATGDDDGPKGETYANALYAASWNGHAKVVKMLLQSGADPTATAGKYPNLLKAASSGHAKQPRTRSFRSRLYRMRGRELNDSSPDKRFESVMLMLLDAQADDHLTRHDKDGSSATDLCCGIRANSPRPDR
ncbi:uncharacterized protein GLRG_03713 [Colletotrichum graminicola M1.001]|uniref:Uncharacterized protein n=1 Tax=Colletotrichum graminicola (strain M1.001 / M2 / FGSC 10212) TaxID=645133 RepID=E3QCI1_COLGM|nr:uncharacterized protein GLRG_03713 [Colletotrichum graminicola M1.001]EFQ28569.1 hypothetical protein GLRG_03713 [Colletotrichum graminicola M1.001]